MQRHKRHKQILKQTHGTGPTSTDCCSTAAATAAGLGGRRGIEVLGGRWGGGRGHGGWRGQRSRWGGLRR